MMGLTNSQKIELIESFEDKIVSKVQIMKRFCDVIHNDSIKVFNSLRRINKIEYLFQSYYYIKTESERINRVERYSLFEKIAVVLNKLNVDWYFGLYTANDINKVLWQPSKNIYVVNSKFSKQIKLDNQKIIFHKIKKELIANYTTHKTKNRIKLHISTNEKTLEDFTYFNKKIPIELKEIIEK